MFARWELNELVGDSIQLVRFKLKRNRIKVHFEPTAPVFVNVHRGQIQQVLLNLFINAEEAMPDGGEITVKLMPEREEGYVRILFSDTGCGIPDAIRNEIFDSFLTGKSQGSGLGLAVVKRILRDHRGDISIQDTSHQGTTFCFWLPLYQASE